MQYSKAQALYLIVFSLVSILIMLAISTYFIPFNCWNQNLPEQQLIERCEQ